MKVQEKKSQKHHIRWMLVCYDAVSYTHLTLPTNSLV